MVAFNIPNVHVLTLQKLPQCDYMIFPGGYGSIELVVFL